MEYASIPEGIADYARLHADNKEQLFREMDEFTKRYPDTLGKEFVKWWGFHIEMPCSPKTVVQFFDMIRAIVNDPSCYKQHENSGNVRPRDD